MPEYQPPRCPSCRWFLRFRERYRRWEAYCWNPACQRQVIRLMETTHTTLDAYGVPLD